MKLTAWFTSPTVKNIRSKQCLFSSNIIKRNVDLEKRSPSPYKGYTFYLR